VWLDVVQVGEPAFDVLAEDDVGAGEVEARVGVVLRDLRGGGIPQFQLADRSGSGSGVMTTAPATTAR
jgi:hypothetical protein